MPVISVCSPKGGVGKTTVVANLAYAFSRSGSKVVVVDFDPQNALRLYFGLSLNDERGIVTLPNKDWISSCISVDKNLYMLPFGKSDKEQRAVFDEALKQDNYFKNVQSSLFDNPDVLVIADFAPGYTQALDSIASVSNLQEVPLIADAASVSLFSQLLSGGLMDGLVGGGLGYYIVLNQIDNRIKLNREVQNFALQNFKDNLLGMIHKDTNVTEAAGQQISVYDYNKNSAAAFDIEVIAKKVAQILGFDVKKGTMVINPLRRQNV
jgi:cellulose synthase operon protein YhjQ